MSKVPSTAAPAADRQLPPRLDLVLALLVALGAMGYFAINVDREINLAEEGTILYIGERILRGMVLYRDMNHHVSPGVFYLTAALMKVGGVAANPTRDFMLLLFGSSAALVYLVSRAVAERPFALISAVAFVFLERRYYSVIYYSPIATFLGLLALAGTILYQRKGRSAAIVGAGVAAGLVLCFKQDFAAYTLVAAAGGLLLPLLARGRGTLYPRDGRELAKAGVGFSIGYAASVAPMIGYFAVEGALDDMFRYCVLFVLHGFSQDYSLPWPDPLASMPDGFDLGQKVEWLHLRVCLYGTLALLLVAALAVAVGLARGKRGRRFAAFASTFLLAALTFLGAFPRTDGYHVVIVLPAALVLFAMLLSLLAQGLGAGPRVEARELAVMALSIAVALPLLLAARFSARADLAERAERHVPFDHPRAHLFLGEPKARALTKLLAYIDSHVPADRPLFVLPYEPGIYFLSGRDNPTRYDMVLPGNVNRDSEEEIVRVLESERVPYIVLIEQYHFDYLRFRKLWAYAPRLYRYIYDHYRVPTDYVVEPTANVGIVGARIADDERALYRVDYDFIDEFRNWNWGTWLPDGQRVQGIRYVGALQDDIKEWWTVGVKDWMLRRVLFIHPEVPSEKRRYVDYRLTVPAGGVLRTGLGLFEEVWDRDGRGVRFEVTVREGKEELGVFTKFIDPFHVPDHRRWRDFEIDLSAYAGHEVTVSLRTASTSQTNAYAWAGYGAPRVVVYPASDDAPAPDDHGHPVERVLWDALSNLGDARERFEDGDGREVDGPEAVPPMDTRAFGDRLCLFLHTAASSALWHVAAFDVRVPERAELLLEWGMASDVWEAPSGEGARFRVVLRDEAGVAHLLAEGEANPHRNPEDRRVFPLDTDLGSFAGQRVTLELASASRQGTNEYGWAIFGEPRLVRRREP